MPFTLPSIAMPPSLAEEPSICSSDHSFCGLAVSSRFLNQGQYLVPLPSGGNDSMRQCSNIDPRLSFNYKNNILQDKETKGLYNNLINTISVCKIWNNNETDSHNMTIDFLTDPRCREAVS
jgi:hypothetical protein